MRKMYTCVGALILVASCTGQTLEVGSNDGGADGAGGGGGAGGSGGAGGGGGEGGGGGATSCDGGSYAGALNDGSGYNGEAPAACNAADGPAQAFSSVAQVAEAVVGTWFDCDSGANSVLVTLGASSSTAGGLVLTSDGHYSVLQVVANDPSAASTAADWTFVPAGSEDGGSAPITGTYQLVDASATLGPGTYQIRLQPPGGGIYIAQVVMLGSPAKMRFVFSTGPSMEEFAPALPLTFRAGVCNYGQDFGPEYTPTSNADSTAHLQGSWIWCAGPPPYVPNGSQEPVVGIELPGDGTWHALVEDSSGNVARGTATNDEGSATAYVGSLSLGTSNGEGSLSNVVISACEPLISLIGTPVIADRGTIVQKSPTNY